MFCRGMSGTLFVSLIWKQIETRWKHLIASKWFFRAVMKGFTFSFLQLISTIFGQSLSILPNCQIYEKYQNYQCVDIVEYLAGLLYYVNIDLVSNDNDRALTQNLYTSPYHRIQSFEFRYRTFLLKRLCPEKVINLNYWKNDEREGFLHLCWAVATVGIPLF